MADKLTFELVSPERLILSAPVDRVTVPGSEGDFGVMVNHAPFMATLRPGVITVEGGGAEVSDDRLYVRGGFAEVTPAGLTVLAEEALPLGQVDVARIDQQIKDLEEDVRDFEDDDAKLRAEDELCHLRQVRALL